MVSSALRLSPPVRRVLFIILPLMYLAGLVGLNVPVLSPWFRLLIPFNLLASLGILLLFHDDWQPTFVLYCLIAFLTGFFVEVLGVHTGLIFGDYSYGAALGWKIAEVPVVIGVNWLILTYCCGSIIDKISTTKPLKVLLAAACMTFLDVFIEPVAIRLDFWQWHLGEIPLQNYLAWYIISAALFAVFYYLPFRKNNPIAGLLLLLQFLFFALNNVVNFID